MDRQNRIAFLNQQIEKMTKERDELIRLEKAQHETSVQRKPQSVCEENWEEICSELIDAYGEGEEMFLDRRIHSDTSTTKLFFNFVMSSKKYLVLEHILKLPYQIDSGKRFCPCSLVVIKNWKRLPCKKDPYLTATDLKKIAGCSVEKLQQGNPTLQYLYQEIMGEPNEGLESQVEGSRFDGEMSWCEIYPLSTPILLRAGLPDKNWGRTDKFMIVGVILHEAPLY